jgi:hypothetical protein
MTESYCSTPPAMGGHHGGGAGSRSPPVENADGGLERRHQTIRLRDRHWIPRPSPVSGGGDQVLMNENAAISWHFERDPIPYALETDWPVGAAGFEPLHLEIRSAELHPASTGFRRRSGAPLIRDAQVRVPPPGLRVLANSDSNMQRFESRRPSQADRYLPPIRLIPLKNGAVRFGARLIPSAVRCQHVHFADACCSRRW